MIDIYNISAGWADLQIGYCMFSVSYLSDLKGDLDYLFDLDDDVKRIILNGEGHGDLSLTAYLTSGNVNQFLSTAKQRNIEDAFDNIINIVWQPLYCGYEDFPIILKFPYKEFMDEYKMIVTNIKENYIENFVCPQNDDERAEAFKKYQEEK